MKLNKTLTDFYKLKRTIWNNLWEVKTICGNKLKVNIKMRRYKHPSCLTIMDKMMNKKWSGPFEWIHNWFLKHLWTLCGLLLFFFLSLLLNFTSLSVSFSSLVTHTSHSYSPPRFFTLWTQKSTKWWSNEMSLNNNGTSFCFIFTCIEPSDDPLLRFLAFSFFFQSIL